MHPLALFFLRDFCRRNDWDVDWLLSCMDPDGGEWMPEGTALEIEELSSGEVPLKSWPRVIPEPRLSAGLLPGEEPPMLPRAAAATKARPRPADKAREGRPPNNPDFPMYAYLRKHKMSAVEFGKKEEVAHQRISYYANGLRAITKELADRWERITGGEVPWTCWPIVHSQATGQYWSLGKKVTPEQVRAVRDRAASK